MPLVMLRLESGSLSIYNGNPHAPEGSSRFNPKMTKAAYAYMNSLGKRSDHACFTIGYRTLECHGFEHEGYYNGVQYNVHKLGEIIIPEGVGGDELNIIYHQPYVAPPSSGPPSVPTIAAIVKGALKGGVLAIFGGQGAVYDVFTGLASRGADLVGLTDIARGIDDLGDSLSQVNGHAMRGVLGLLDPGSLPAPGAPDPTGIYVVRYGQETLDSIVGLGGNEIFGGADSAGGNGGDGGDDFGDSLIPPLRDISDALNRITQFLRDLGEPTDSTSLPRKVDWLGHVSDLLDILGKGMGIVGASLGQFVRDAIADAIGAASEAITHAAIDAIVKVCNDFVGQILDSLWDDLADDAKKRSDSKGTSKGTSTPPNSSDPADPVDFAAFYYQEKGIAQILHNALYLETGASLSEVMVSAPYPGSLYLPDFQE